MICQNSSTIPTTRDWSLMLYLAGDNDLSDAGLADIQEMQSEGGSPNVYLSLQIDTKGELEGSVRYELLDEAQRSGNSIRVEETLPEGDSGDPQILLDFIQWAMPRYPATNRMLTIWGHGTGFRTSRQSRFADSNGTPLEVTEIADALKRASFGFNGVPKLQLLGFDACLMNIVEVVHHLSDYADIFVGSQEVEPSDGWSYQKLLQSIKRSPSPPKLATEIVASVIEEYSSQADVAVTQSAIITRETNLVIQYLDTLGNALLSQGPDSFELILDIRQRSQRFHFDDYVDLLDFTRNLLSSPPNSFNSQVLDAASTVADATLNSIIVSAAKGSTVARAKGLSFWFPGRAIRLQTHRAEYLKLKCNQRSFGWLNFLDYLYS